MSIRQLNITKLFVEDLRIKSKGNAPISLRGYQLMGLFGFRRHLSN